MKSYSLSEFLTSVQYAVRASFPDRYWVRAEISSLSCKPNSHCYMELAESGEDSRSSKGDLYAAKIKANCWRNVWQAVSTAFTASVGQPLKVGMQVLAQVSIDFHPTYGMSLTVHDIDASFTLGDLARKKQETLKRLEADGVIDMQKALRMPTLPKRLAVISSASAAGYQDFEHQLANNPQGYTFRLTLFPALMQGDMAAESIISSLLQINEREAEFDAVVLIRGGGASSDLSCFDDYLLASACAQFPLPIITGIGHTRDISVVDRVAFLAVKTPTAAAEYFINILAEQEGMIDALTDRLQSTAVQQIRLREQRLEHLEVRCRMAYGHRIERQRSQLDLLEKTIELHSPMRIFRKGYSLTLRDGKVVTSAQSLKEGDCLTTIFADGEVSSEVKSRP